MKIRSILIIISVSIVSCTHDVEIPKDHVGITYDNVTKEISDSVYLSGKHILGLDISVVFYDVRPKTVDFLFDFLFEDVSSGKINFSLIYSPIIDSLPAFYNDKNTARLDIYINREIKDSVRSLMGNISKDNLDEKLVFEKIKHLLADKNELNRIVIINEFVAGEIIYD